MAYWDFSVEGTGWSVVAHTTYAAKAEAQALLDREYGKGKYAADIAQEPRKQPRIVVVAATKALPSKDHKVWEYRVRVAKGARDELYVTETVVAVLPATAAVKAQVALDERYGPGKYYVVVKMGPRNRPFLDVREIA